MRKFIGGLLIALIGAAATLGAAYLAQQDVRVYVSNIFSDSNSNDSLLSEVVDQRAVPREIETPESLAAITVPEETQPDSSQSSEVTVESGMIGFTLKEVIISGQSLKFGFTLQNNDENKRAITLSSARIIDDDGVVYTDKKISIAKTSSYMFDLPENVPVQMEILFEGVNNEIGTVQFLEIKGKTYGKESQRIEVSMRDLTVE